MRSLLSIAANCKARVDDYKPYGELAVVRLGRFFDLTMLADFYSGILSLSRFGRQNLVGVLVMYIAGRGDRPRSFV